MNSLYRIGAGFSPAERLAVAQASLARLSAAGWKTAEEIHPHELAADPEAVVAMGIIAAQASRNVAPAIAGAAAEMAPVVMEAIGGYLRRKNERKEERRNRSRGSDSGESRVYLPAFPPPPPPPKKPNNTKWFILGGIGLALVLVLFLFLRK